MSRSIRRLAVFAGLVIAWGTAAAQDRPQAPTSAPQRPTIDGWPSKTVRLVVPGTGGSGPDLVARIFTESLTRSFGQPFVVDLKAGANGVIASEDVARAPRDGHTLLLTYAGAHVVNQFIVPKIPYDVTRDFAAIAQIGAAGTLLVVRQDMPVTDLNGFIEHVRSKAPDTFTYGSWGIGSGGHLNMEALAQNAGLLMRHAPYKSAPAAINDLLGGHIDASFAVASTVAPHLKSGRLKALAISGPYRSPAAPEVRTMTEQGVRMDLVAWYGLFAPAGTPPRIIAALNQEVNRIISAPENAERWLQLGFSQMPLRSPEQFTERVRQDLDEWGAVVRAAKIKVE
jgi:tripartite-type tricarboxylate transporter receptor subunit TctC